MDKKKEKKLINGFGGRIRREQEIQEYGKILSLRPSLVHKSQKIYCRKSKHKNKLNILD